MNMKRIIAIFQRDLSDSLRDNILLYIMLAPILIALVLRFMVPSVQEFSLQFAFTSDIDQKIIQEFKTYGKIEMFTSQDALAKRVQGIDDIAGITKNDNGELVLILEGNETHDAKAIPQKILRSISGQEEYHAEYQFSDLGMVQSPLVSYGGIFLAIMSFAIGGVIIGFHVIDEKENGTMRALSVSPMTKLEFIIGRSIIGMILPLIQIFIIFLILGIKDVNFAFVSLVTFVSSLIGILLGFLIGVLSSNQIAGIANFKVMFTILIFPIILLFILPENKEFFLYWTPSYWSFVAYREIILNTITMAQLGTYLSGVIVTTLLAFILLKKRIVKGLI